VTNVAPPTASHPAAVASSGAGAASSSPRYRRRPWLTRLRRDRTLLIMTVPALVLLAVFGYAPMLGLVMAFQDYDLYDGLMHSPWV
jgi:putative aldouronate transport system permease protein